MSKDSSSKIRATSHQVCRHYKLRLRIPLEVRYFDEWMSVLVETMLCRKLAGLSSMGMFSCLQGGPTSSATLRERSRASRSRDSRVDSGSVDLETPQSESSSKSPLDALGEALVGSGMAIDDYRPIPPPRSKLVSQLTSSPNSIRKTSRPESECILSSTGEMNAANTSGLLASLACQNGSSLPDKHRSLHVPAAPLEGKKLSKKKTKPLVMSDELHDYSEIYTPSNEEDKVGAWPDAESMSTAESSGGRTGSGDSGLTGLSGGTGTDVDQERPPPRPLHRYPSWENRIYEVAKEGVSGDQIDNTRNNNENRNSALLSGGYGDEINVPVYASLKGVSLDSSLKCLMIILRNETLFRRISVEHVLLDFW